MNKQDHWENIYKNKELTKVGWFQERPGLLLEIIEKRLPNLQSSIIDVGSGSTLLTDLLLAAGYENLTLLDLSQAALDKAQARIGSAAEKLNWVVGDVLEYEGKQQFDLWHDRACFHFLLGDEERNRYFQSMTQALKPGGLALISTFAVQGPEKCSGLPVQRWGEEEIKLALSDSYSHLASFEETHQTPTGVPQAFSIFLFQKK